MFCFITAQMSSTVLGSSHPSKAATPLMLSQHKRSLSFNHHLSYNQYAGSHQHNHQQLQQQQQQPKSLGYINHNSSTNDGLGGTATIKPTTGTMLGGSATKGPRNIKGMCVVFTLVTYLLTSVICVHDPQKTGA